MDGLFSLRVMSLQAAKGAMLSRPAGVASIPGSTKIGYHEIGGSPR
jgi:hypothetical protein